MGPGIYFPFGGGFGKKLLNFVAIPGVVSPGERRVEFGISRVAMSLGQSPLAASSGVGSSGCPRAPLDLLRFATGLRLLILAFSI